ncbi:hypothetical protein B296_00047635 [Ensete ventricosum]|uniref:YegS/DAGK C-terminal domain-containing protein n=1 Tax=Ensete ventricosum TaxID=4639 RepID=A0A426YN75_ENSVE|nr:hypothetical protein B296_00047635 [Ensete ventricosum]
MAGTADKTETSVPTLTERARIDGAPAKASLAADGTLRWISGDGGERCLALESEGLGLDVVGRRITIRAFVGALKGLSSCGGRGGAGKRVRRDHVLEMPTEELASRWSDRMRAYFDSLGKPPKFLGEPFGRQLSVVNGLLHREDWDTAIQVPLGVIPAGIIASYAQFSDGYLDAVIIKECPKSALLSLMLKMSDGSYCKSPHVVYLKVKAFRLEPGKQVGHPTKGGIIDSDGEVIARGDDVHLTFCASHLNLIVRSHLAHMYIGPREGGEVSTCESLRPSHEETKKGLPHEEWG